MINKISPIPFNQNLNKYQSAELRLWLPTPQIYKSSLSRQSLNTRLHSKCHKRSRTSHPLETQPYIVNQKQNLTPNMQIYFPSIPSAATILQPLSDPSTKISQNVRKPSFFGQQSQQQDNFKIKLTSLGTKNQEHIKITSNNLTKHKINQKTILFEFNEKAKQNKANNNQCLLTNRLRRRVFRKKNKADYINCVSSINSNKIVGITIRKRSQNIQIDQQQKQKGKYQQQQLMKKQLSDRLDASYLKLTRQQKQKHEYLSDFVRNRKYQVCEYNKENTQKINGSNVAKTKNKNNLLNRQCKTNINQSRMTGWSIVNDMEYYQDWNQY